MEDHRGRDGDGGVGVFRRPHGSEAGFPSVGGVFQNGDAGAVIAGAGGFIQHTNPHPAFGGEVFRQSGREFIPDVSDQRGVNVLPRVFHERIHARKGVGLVHVV